MSSPKTGPGPNPEQPLAGPALKSAPERNKWGNRICEHGRRPSRCKDCGNGSELCTHNRQRHSCKDCGGTSICAHNRVSNECLACKPSSAFRRLLRTSKNRGYTCTLSSGLAHLIASQSCFYCGGPAGWLDRRKNDIGYTPTNSIPCCSQCNMSKGKLSAGNFIEGSQRVAAYCPDKETFMQRNAELQKQIREFEQWRDSEDTND